MDPDEALDKIRTARQVIEKETDTAKIDRAIDDVIDGFDALDGWLSNGGFLPRAWNRGRG